jgi:hypothetical protein
VIDSAWSSFSGTQTTTILKVSRPSGLRVQVYRVFVLLRTTKVRSGLVVFGILGSPFLNLFSTY